MRKSTKTLRQLGGPSDPRHGTAGGYSYWGCRCGPCREAATASVRAYRDRAEITTHGRYGYDLGCRCQVCTSGKRKQNAEGRRKRREWRAEHRPPAVRKVNLSGMA